MKKIFKALLILSALFFFSPPAAMAGHSAKTESYAAEAGEKLGNGIANVATGFLELPKTMILTSRSEGPAYGMTIGLLTGVLHTVGRTLFGVVDVATFLFPTGTSVKPEVIWEDFNKETTYGN